MDAFGGNMYNIKGKVFEEVRWEVHLEVKGAVQMKDVYWEVKNKISDGVFEEVWAKVDVEFRDGVFREVRLEILDEVTRKVQRSV